MKKHEPTEYDLQAQRFIEKTGLKIRKVYCGHGPYFDGEKESRARWEITIERADHRPITFMFGASIVDSWAVSEGHSWRREEPTYSKAWNFLVVKDAIRCGVEYNSGYGLSVKFRKDPPTDYTILSCVEKHDPGTFDDFCAEYGYDNDSIKTRETYFAVQKQWSGIRGLFNNDELAELQEIN